jgi:hypothetical protein
VPVYKPPVHYKESVYLGGRVRERDILGFFRGDLGLNREGCVYSRWGSCGQIACDTAAVWFVMQQMIQ